VIRIVLPPRVAPEIGILDANDDLVAWGWSPGEGRQPAPGSQQQLGELAQAWIDSGAQCP